jgi:hypothetical protein
MENNIFFMLHDARLRKPLVHVASPRGTTAPMTVRMCFVMPDSVRTYGFGLNQIHDLCDEALAKRELATFIRNGWRRH